MKKILIPVDFSEFSERAIEEGKKMTKAFDCEVLLLHVVGLKISTKRFSADDPMPQWVDPFSVNEKNDAGELLKEYKEFFGEKKNRVETLVLHGWVADEIIKTANRPDIDFVIMGSNGIGSVLYRTLLGSITNKVIHHCEKPILVIR